MHVESAKRLEAIVAKLEAEGLLTDYLVPVPITDAMATGVHGKEYLGLLRSLTEGRLDMDTYVHPETYQLALLAAGGAVAAGRQAEVSGTPAVALVRPPGHHAGPDHGGGFCYLNNVAIAARDLLQRVPRVAILDYDAHHGNGTEEVFLADPRVLYVSTHQYGIFPGTGAAEVVGEGEARGHTVNIPFPAKAGDSSFEAAYLTLVDPIVRKFQPSVILVSFGVDAHYKDPITSLTLSSPGYVRLAGWTLELAKEVCGGRVAFVLEGGYHPTAISEVIAAVLARLHGRDIHLQYTEVLDSTERGREAVDRARGVHRRFWGV
jgi:acetoin utilization deacetylase AcuC-like enzyme